MLLKRLMQEDSDIAVLRSMAVDHGFAQAGQLLLRGLSDTLPVPPIFLNAEVQPGIP